MKRFIETKLEEWLQRPRRKPLIIRGARQVGKSTLVRNFAAAQGLNLVEINLERHLRLNHLFQTGDVTKILSELEALSGQRIGTEKTLLFLDEIQATPAATAALRYFYEEKPEIPVIAAGSLLEFVLATHDFSMPVGRIEYLHLGPMSFQEFLLALGETQLLSYLHNYELSESFPEMAHQRLLERQREFIFVGGMPESVLVFCQSGSLAEARGVHRSIIQTYQDDFAKYAKLTELTLLHMVFDRLSRMIGEKIKYSNIAKDERSAKLKGLIDLLIKARLYIPVYHSDCSGLPLKAGVNQKVFKLFFLDIGLANYLNGLDWSTISNLDERQLVNEGEIAEQFVAQHLAYRFKGLEPPEIHYWLREGRSVNAEVDFVISLGRQVIPIEVKSGKSGRLKSLQQFAIINKTQMACRLDLNLPTKQTIVHQLRQKDKIARATLNLVSLPLYFVEEMERLFIAHQPSTPPKIG